MKLYLETVEISEEKYPDEWYVMIDDKDSIMDDEIADVLGLTYEEYEAILIQHGAYIAEDLNGLDYTCLQFNDRSAAERAIEALEPYLIMANLMGE